METIKKITSFLLFWRKEPPNPENREIYPSFQRNDTETNQDFANNKIRTSKYTILTFLPKNLYEQFHRFANLYFVGVVILDWMPEIGAFGKELALFPVLFVLSVTAIKDAFEDFRRHRSDNKINNQRCYVWNLKTKEYEENKWKNIQPGDFVHLNENDVIPADVLVLSSSEPGGICYVETSNLDGESNLKQKFVLNIFQNKDNDNECSKGKYDPFSFNGKIKCEGPNCRLNKFSGHFLGDDGRMEGIAMNNLLLRGSTLKKTHSAQGIVIYAGHETRAMKNSTGPRFKQSSLEKMMNIDVLWCVIILLILCLTCGIGNGIWVHSMGNAENAKNVPFYVDTVNPQKTSGSVDPQPKLSGVFAFFSSLIVLQTLIPLSLYVSLELIKLGLIYFISKDKELYHKESGTKVECRALNIPEELGQIEYVMSDKTGTLTENQMIFRKCAIYGVDFSCSNSPEKGKSTSSIYSTKEEIELCKPLVKAISRLSQNYYMEDDGEDKEFLSAINNFFLCLLLCNTVVVSTSQDEPKEDGIKNEPSSNASGVGSMDASFTSLSPLVGGGVRCSSTDSAVDISESSFSSLETEITPSIPEYQGESPDEEALVYAAAMYGYILKKRHAHYVYICTPNKSNIRYKVLHILHFDPVRKRMSVIVEEEGSRKLKLFCKGADTVIMSLLCPHPTKNEKKSRKKSEKLINKYATEGLRTLCVAEKDLSEDEYQVWKRDHEVAEASLDDKEILLFKSAMRIESQLSLLGITGVEDRLQDGVSDTIESLRKAAIKIWVLTGDKAETAENVAYASKLFTDQMQIITLNAANKEELSEKLPEILKTTSNLKKPIGILITGSTLQHCFNPQNEVTIPEFTELVQKAESVLCCRVTPLQKSNVVKLVKQQLKKKTLAIGDGANDVAMIQSAEVGVGINGQEGMQAVMASDYALPRFRFLKRLLLVHGHWCYDRLARIMQYFFYENALFVFTLFWFQMYSGFSSQTIVDPMYLILYGVLFTGIPPVIMGVLDQCAPDHVLFKNPYLYKVGKDCTLYKRYHFWISMLQAVWQSLVVFFYSYLVYRDTNIDLWAFGFLIFTALVVTNESFLALQVKSWTVLQAGSIIFSVLIYFTFSLLYNAVTGPGGGVDDPPVFVSEEMMSSPIFYLSLFYIVIFANFPSWASKVLVSTLSLSDVLKARLTNKMIQ